MIKAYLNLIKNSFKKREDARFVSKLRKACTEKECHQLWIWFLAKRRIPQESIDVIVQKCWGYWSLEEDPSYHLSKLLEECMKKYRDATVESFKKIAKISTKAQKSLQNLDVQIAKKIFYPYMEGAYTEGPSHSPYPPIYSLLR